MGVSIIYYLCIMNWRSFANLKIFIFLEYGCGGEKRFQKN